MEGRMPETNLMLPFYIENPKSIVRRTNSANPLPSKELHKERQSRRRFSTKSSYKGQWSSLNMDGSGDYEIKCYDDDFRVSYEGYFDDGTFHGHGRLVYPAGHKVEGLWVHGELKEKKVIFTDKEEYPGPDWDYCKMPDRRFQIEIRNGLRPAGRSYMTQRQPPHKIPPGCYDCGEGYFDPRSKSIRNFDDNSFIRVPPPDEEAMIIRYYRKAENENVGFRKDLYENWFKDEENNDQINTGKEDRKLISTKDNSLFTKKRTEDWLYDTNKTQTNTV